MSLSDHFGDEIQTSYIGNSSCRHQPTLVFKVGDLEVFGASECHVTRQAASHFDLVVNLTGHRKFKTGASMIQAPRKWAFLRRYLADAPLEELVFDWKDQGVFPVGRDFWINFLEQLKRDDYRKILFFCVGGHGRTGSAIGCLMTVALDIHGGQAIRRIKDGYCKKAIETKGQEEYVRSMTQKEN